MAGYLDHYGAGEERRNRIILRSVLAVVIIGIVSSLTWYLTLNHHQESVVKSFVAALKRGNTEEAYRIWGCTAAHPCRGYSYQQFLQDWGPGPNGPNLSVLALTDSEECNSAVMITVRVNKDRAEHLWLDRHDDTIGFAPFNVCPAQIPYEIMVHRTLGKLRNILL